MILFLALLYLVTFQCILFKISVMFRCFTIAHIMKQNLLKPFVINCNKKCFVSQLVEIGQLKPPQTYGYEIGQLFIHKLFGYRGLIVFPWVGNVYDRDLRSEKSNSKVFVGGKEVKFSTQNYYQVFIDSRDRPYVRALDEISTNTENIKSLSSLFNHASGLDFVAHEDIIPYKATEETPMTHEMLGKFFIHKPTKDPCFEPTDVLRLWLSNNFGSMKLDIHKETTEQVRITAIPFYLGSQRVKNTNIYSWKYSIRLENFSDSAIRLVIQDWRLWSLSGLTETVCCRGVMGEEVVMDSSLPAFQYSSHVNLLSPYGHMSGTFHMEREDGTQFNCRIPLILLESRLGPNEILL